MLKVNTRQRGFTMIEIVVAIAVLALLLLAAMPSIGTWMDNARIRNVADALQNGIQIARAEAVRRNENVSFWLVSLEDPNLLANDCQLSATSGSWIVSVDAPTSHCGDAPSIDSSPKIVTGHAAGNGGKNVLVAAVQSDNTTAATSITFNGFGRLVNTGAIARISVTGPVNGTEYRNLRIAITPAGLVRMCDPRATDSTDPRKCPA